MLAAAVTLPLLFRSRQPLPSLTVVLVASTVQFQLGAGDMPQSWFAFLLCFYSVAAHEEMRQALVGAGLTAVAVLATDVTKLVAGEPIEDVVTVWFFLGGVFGFGRWLRGRRHESELVRQKAELLESRREEVERAAAAEERSRIARELHDLVAHNMSVIVLQAQGASRVLERDPTAARSALSAIENSGRQGLEELRRLLGLLRTEDEDAPLDPQPGLRNLTAFVEQVRAAGLPVELKLEGEWASLPPSLDLSAYRIVQEALTNALRHAGPAHATVTVSRHSGDLEVEIVDDGPGAASEAGSQLGLVGMRERVNVYGGTLETGRRPEGGFRVRARLPIEPMTSS
jgi:signal transduction histidine kinase